MTEGVLLVTEEPLLLKSVTKISVTETLTTNWKLCQNNDNLSPKGFGG